jgi:hypothetical protein
MTADDRRRTAGGSGPSGETTSDREIHDKRAFEDQKGMRCLGLQLNIVYFYIRGHLCRMLIHRR